MLPLRELQSTMMEALLGGPPDAAAALLAGSAESARASVRVYRNTLVRNFEDALRSSFPVVARLVGADYFGRSAAAYQRLRPSRSGDLLHVGDGFAHFLAQGHRDGEFAYLTDIARLEWLIQEALLAAPFGALDLRKLASVVPEAYDDLRFALHPSLRLFESSFPALAIWQANSSGTGEPDLIDLRSGGVRLAIMRRGLQLEFHLLQPGERAFLSAVAGRERFAAAVAHAVHVDAAFDAAATLRRFVSAQAIVDFEIFNGT